MEQRVHKLKHQGGINISRQFGKLYRIDNNERIDMEKHDDFLHNMQIALLLALEEQGRLTFMQFRYAEEMLKQKRRNHTKRFEIEG